MESFVMAVMEQYGGALVAVAGVLGALVFIWQKAVIPVRRWAIRMGATIESLNEVAQAQLTGNGGSSLLDKVGKIEPNHDEVKAALTAAEDAVKAELLRAELKETERWTDLDRRLKAIESHPPTVTIHNDPHIGPSAVA